jgi:hypothetical protein
MADMSKSAKLAAEVAAAAKVRVVGVGVIGVIKPEELVFSTIKIIPQMAERGWTKESVKALIDNSYTIRTSTSRLTNNPATVFYAKTGDYVVVNNITKEVVQVTDKAKVAKNIWFPDMDTVNAYIPYVPHN